MIRGGEGECCEEGPKVVGEIMGVGGDQTGEQDGKVGWCWVGGALLTRVERGEGSADSPLENFTIMSMLKQVGQFALVWSGEESQSAVWQPT